MKVKVISLWGESAGNYRCVHMCTCKRWRLSRAQRCAFVHLEAGVQGSPSTAQFYPSQSSFGSFCSAWLSCKLLVPALYSWNTLTTEPFISHPRCSSHTWHTWWALKGAAAMWGWFALHLVPPHPYQCPIYLYSYNPDPLMRRPQMSGWALSCLLLTSSAS